MKSPRINIICCGMADSAIVLLAMFWFLLKNIMVADWVEELQKNSNILLYWALPLLLLTFWRGVHDAQRTTQNRNWFGRATIEGFAWGFGFAVVCGAVYYVQTLLHPGGEEWFAPNASFKAWVDYLFLVSLFGIVTGGVGLFGATCLHFLNRLLLYK